MKFNKGDRIRAKDTGLEAEIVGVVVHPFLLITQYQTVWDGFKGAIVAYNADDVDSLWDLVSTNVVVKLPAAIDFVPLNLDWSGIKSTCDHKWVEVSFAHSKMVCFHCDMEMPKP
jgi:RNAse (barnase) inhibitor barstar